MDARRHLPAVDRLLRAAPELPHDLARDEARALLDAVRAGDCAAPEDWTAALRARVAARRRLHLRRVINATGVVLHTNLGRAPLSPAAAAAVHALAEGYSNLELDLATGERGERLQGLRELLAGLVGAESAVAVNNNAAAVLLALTALARGREVLVSRGELVEIGGAFRVPDVVAAGGAVLREVGTTNRTRVADYAAAIGPETAAILKVHPSNFRIVGFTSSPSREELAGLARARGILLLEDLGAGALVPGLGEPTVREVLAAGVDLATFSGDKLLGGPQAGIAVGSATLVSQLRRHPLYRALRLDRLVLAALEATLRGYAAGELPPAVLALRADPGVLRARAETFAAELAAAGLVVAVQDDWGVTGGGSRPGEALASTSLALPGDPERLAAALRAGTPPVIGRIHEGALRVDLRCVRNDELGPLAQALLRACGVGGGA